ncbi:MAG: hypothetical protein ABSG43_14050 [Solirubrobacteraceae bacterium]
MSLLEADERTRVLSGAAALAAEIVEPTARVEAREIRTQETLYARLYGLYWVCPGLSARHPIVLAIDDAHWGDDTSLQWLLFMARRAGDLPVTLAVSARPVDSGEWPQSLALLAAEPSASFIRPQPLSELASTVLIAGLLGEEPDEPFAAACHRVTGGNPFLLTELIASAQADVLSPTASSAAQILSLAPEGVTRSVLVRLGRLSRPASALAQCVAVLGSEAEFRHAAALADLDPGEASAAADALTASGLLSEGRPLRLIHPVVRTSLNAELPARERAQLHGRAARMLADENADWDAVAAHLLASEPTGERWAVELLLKAADRAAARGAAKVSASYLRRALEEPPAADQRGAVLRRLSVVESRRGEPAAAEHAREAMELASEPRQRARLALELSGAYLVAGRFAQAIDTLEQALVRVSASDEELRWRLEAQLIRLARLDRRHAGLARRHLDQVPHDLPGDTPGRRVILAELACAALMAGEPVDEVIELATRALGSGRLIAEQPLGSWSVMNAIWALAHSDQHGLAMDAYDALIVRSQQQGSPILFAWVSSRRSQLHYFRGEIPDAIADAQASIDAGGQFGQSLVVAGLYARLIDALLAAGDTAGAARALELSGMGDKIPELWQFFMLLQSRGRLRLAEGATQAGIDDLLACYQTISCSPIWGSPTRLDRIAAQRRPSRWPGWAGSTRPESRPRTSYSPRAASARLARLAFASAQPV